MCINFPGIGLRETVRTQLCNAGVHSDGLAGKMATYVLDSKAGATNKKYFDYFKHFKSYCISKGFPYQPASSIHVAIYLTHLLDSKVSFHVICAAFYGIKWFHVTNDLPDIVNSWVKSLLEAGKRLNSVPVKKKDTINSDMLKDLRDVFKCTEDVLHLRDLALILLGYAGFLRFNEINELKCNDTEFKDDHVILKIRKK